MYVVPAKAGTPFAFTWTPAFAGGTPSVDPGKKNPPPLCGRSGGPSSRFGSVADDFSVVDAHYVHARHVLRALLARRALLDEGDVAVDAFHLHVPQRVLDRLGLGLAGVPDRLDDGLHAVPAAEALGQAADLVFARGPLADELLGDVGVLHRVGEPRREEHQVVGAVRRLAGLGDELVRRDRAAGGDDARLHLLLLRLAQDERRLLDRGGDEERVAARSLDLRELRREVGRLRVHGLHDPDLHAVVLQHLREFLRRAEA